MTASPVYKPVIVSRYKAVLVNTHFVQCAIEMSLGIVCAMETGAKNGTYSPLFVSLPDKHLTEI